MFVLYEKKE